MPRSWLQRFCCRRCKFMRLHCFLQGRQLLGGDQPPVAAGRRPGAGAAAAAGEGDPRPRRRGAAPFPTLTVVIVHSNNVNTAKLKYTGPGGAKSLRRFEPTPRMELHVVMIEREGMLPQQPGASQCRCHSLGICMTTCHTI